eukprot:2765751-Pyramimonas_sp.AAC.1
MPPTGPRGGSKMPQRYLQELLHDHGGSWGPLGALLGLSWGPLGALPSSRALFGPSELCCGRWVAGGSRGGRVAGGSQALRPPARALTP